MTDVPVVVGFGVSSAEQVKAIGEVADAVVVGSALIDVIAREGAGGAERFFCWFMSRNKEPGTRN